MKKLLRYIILFCMIICMALGLAACSSACGTSSAPANELVGTWEGTGNEVSTITFKNNGMCIDDAGSAKIEGPYTINESMKFVKVKDEETGLEFAYSYTLTGDSLVLQMDLGFPRTFKRVK